MTTEFKNPAKWRYTWEAQSHLPILKLFLFNPIINPSLICVNLNSKLILEKSLIKTTWFEPKTNAENFIIVPIPNVLIDGEAQIHYKALYDYIEVRVVLLLPVDHPIFVRFDKNVRLNEEGFGEFDSSPLSINEDLKRLCLGAEGVRFYCRSCSAQLTRPVKSFAEMPSTNWSEVADNWFGGCCCSFGGISDKLVAKYANSYASTAGTCLLSTTFVFLSKDDLVQCDFGNTMINIGDENGRVTYCDNLKEETVHHADSGELKFDANLECNQQHPDRVTSGEILRNMSTMSDNLKEETVHHTNPGEIKLAANQECHQQHPDKVTNGTPSDTLAMSELSNDVFSASGCCGNGAQSLKHITENEYLETPGTGTCLEDQPLIKTFELPDNKKSFLNGFLGDIFMSRSSNLSKDVHWVDFLCPQCSSFLGAYPTTSNECKILDGGVRLFKCYISTCLPNGDSNDLFRKYTLERMFTNQLVENAKSELSYRTVIRDLRTKSAMLQIVLLNPNSFIQGGNISDTENKLEAVETVDLSSAIKVLFADCSRNIVSQTRLVEEWLTKNQADEVYMFAHQIKELIKTLNLAKNMFPFSCTSLQGLALASLRR